MSIDISDELLRIRDDGGDPKGTYRLVKRSTLTELAEKAKAISDEAIRMHFGNLLDRVKVFEIRDEAVRQERERIIADVMKLDIGYANKRKVAAAIRKGTT